MLDMFAAPAEGEGLDRGSLAVKLPSHKRPQPEFAPRSGEGMGRWTPDRRMWSTPGPAATHFDCGAATVARNCPKVQTARALAVAPCDDRGGITIEGEITLRPGDHLIIAGRQCEAAGARS